MKVRDLIAELNKHDPDNWVCLPGYEGGYYHPKIVMDCVMAMNVNEEWYYGPHEMFTEDQYPDHEHLTVVVVR